jgi:hypothetical protein
MNAPRITVALLGAMVVVTIAALQSSDEIRVAYYCSYSVD